jgi:hypothetical protein
VHLFFVCKKALHFLSSRGCCREVALLAIRLGLDTRSTKPKVGLVVVRHEIAYHFVVAIFFQLIFDRIVVKMQT